MNHDDWKHLCGSFDMGRGELEHPWQHEDKILCSDGTFLFSCPASVHRHVPFAGPGGPAPPASAQGMLLAARGAPVHRPEMWPLMCWAGPLPNMGRACRACEGLGTVAWLPALGASEDGEPGEYVGPSDERPGARVQPGCGDCDGDGWIESEMVPVSVYGVPVDAGRLARVLWALVRLDWGSDAAHVEVFVGSDRLLFVRGGAEALLMAMRSDDTRRAGLCPRWSTSWPADGGLTSD